MSLLKTISTKTVYGDKEKILQAVMVDTKKEVLLYRVVGIIEGHTIGKGKHKRVDRETGEAVDSFWTKFFGEFQAVNTDGEVFESAVCFLPDYVSGQFVTALEADAQTLGIEFAYDVYARYAKDSITSYEFIALPVRKKGEESKLKTMLTELPPMPGAPALADQSAAGKKK